MPHQKSYTKLPHEPLSSSVGATWPLTSKNTQNTMARTDIPASISPKREYTSVGVVRPKCQHAKNAIAVAISDWTPLALYTGTLPAAVGLASNRLPGMYTWRIASKAA